MFLRHIQPFALAWSLGWAYGWEEHFSGEAGDRLFSEVARLWSYVGIDALKHVHSWFMDIDTVCGHSDSLLGIKRLLHGEEVDVVVCQHASRQIVYWGCEPSQWVRM